MFYKDDKDDEKSSKHRLQPVPFLSSISVECYSNCNRTIREKRKIHREGMVFLKDDLTVVKAGEEKPKVRLVFAGGDGLKIAFRLLAKKVLKVREQEEKECVQQSTLE